MPQLNIVIESGGALCLTARFKKEKQNSQKSEIVGRFDKNVYSAFNCMANNK